MKTSFYRESTRECQMSKHLRWRTWDYTYTATTLISNQTPLSLHNLSIFSKLHAPSCQLSFCGTRLLTTLKSCWKLQQGGSVMLLKRITQRFCTNILFWHYREINQEPLFWIKRWLKHSQVPLAHVWVMCNNNYTDKLNDLWSSCKAFWSSEPQSYRTKDAI